MTKNNEVRKAAESYVAKFWKADEPLVWDVRSAYKVAIDIVEHAIREDRKRRETENRVQHKIVECPKCGHGYDFYAVISESLEAMLVELINIQPDRVVLDDFHDGELHNFEVYNLTSNDLISTRFDATGSTLAEAVRAALDELRKGDE